MEIKVTETNENEKRRGIKIDTEVTFSENEDIYFFKKNYDVIVEFLKKICKIKGD